MPRQPSKKSPIRQLRAIIGKTQSEFAKSIGVSPSALKRIENKDLKLSRKIAQRIEAEAGADKTKLLSGQLRDVLGKTYTAQFYAKWKKHRTYQDPAIASEHAKRLGWWIEILLRASAVGSKRRLWQVRDALYDALSTCYSDFDLQRPVKDILAKHRMKWTPGALTPEELSEIERERVREEQV